MFNKITYQISLVILGITALYAFVYSGLSGLLLSSAITLIAAAFIEELELVVAAAVIFTILYTTVLKKLLRHIDYFQNPKEIRGRIQAMKEKYHPAAQELKDTRLEPAGVYNPAIEGFADVSKEEKDGESVSSKPAAAKSTANEVSPKLVKEVTTGSTDPFENDFKSATGSLFKLGKMPSEHAEGPKLDAGSTIMKAMSSFDPKTISSMTEDTKKLLETQKGLMSMLNEMRPVLADGKELLNTFSGMFGGNTGTAAGMLKL